MTENNQLITSFAIGGYRSFGNKIQRFTNLSRINLFIGQNNCGKSNILRFLHDIYSALARGDGLNLTQLDRHEPGGSNFISGFAISLPQDENRPHFEFLRDLPEAVTQGRAPDLIKSVYRRKADLDHTNNHVMWSNRSGHSS